MTKILRIFIGLLLATTAFGKALDLPGFATVLATYQFLPESLHFVSGILLTLTEALIAIALLIPSKHRRLAIVAAIALHIYFTLLASITLIRGIEVPNCGCFGVFLARPLTWGTVAEDLFMLGLCVLLYIGHQKSQSAVHA